jgi:DNA-binding XRE family transcriptional regulator
MAKRTRRRDISKRLTEDERAKYAAIREGVEREKPELMALGSRIKARHARLREAVAALKAARESLGLTLQDVGNRSGIGKANLSRLENSRNPNPTIETLSRYAEALGKDIEIVLKDVSRPI